MGNSTYAVHAPALSLPEAAMLPALTREPPGLPRSLLLPDRRSYQPLPAVAVETPPHRGSMAGRAVLNHVKNAPAQRPERRSTRLT